MERLITFFLIFVSSAVYADLLPTELGFTLRQVPTRSDQYTVLELEIKNQSSLHNSILVPGHPQLGMGLFEILAYERGETMKWTPLMVYDPVLPDSAASDHKYMQFWNLSPGECFKQLFVLKLQPSEAWAFQVKYQPHVCTDYFKYAFRWYNDEGEPSEPAIDGDQRFAYQGPMYSNLCEIFLPATGIQLNDQTAKKFYKANWRQVKRHFKRKTAFPDEWPILSKQLYSQTILSSLPSYWHQYLVVDTKDGIYAVYLGYQIGKIRPVRSFLARIAHLCGARRVFWRTSSSKAIKLNYFKIIPFQ